MDFLSDLNFYLTCVCVLCQGLRVKQSVQINLKGQEVCVDITLNTRAKRLQFRLDPQNGHVRLTLPPNTSSHRGLNFVKTKADWILPRLNEISRNKIVLSEGAKIPIDGCLRPLNFGARPSIDNKAITVREICTNQDLSRLLKTRAKARLTPLAHEKANVLGFAIERLTFRDTKSRWGSCSSEGVISINWRIICADLLIQDYLIAHEVAHLKEPHHQPSFWSACASLMMQPSLMDQARDKLKAIGPKLMALPV